MGSVNQLKYLALEVPEWAGTDKDETASLRVQR